MDENLKDSLLKQIELTGSVDTGKVKILLNKSLENVLDKSSGKTRIKPIVKGRFNLILSSVLSMSPLEIRCLNCKRVISYPCWHYSIAYAVNVFHYFLCFNNGKVSLDCKGK